MLLVSARKNNIRQTESFFERKKKCGVIGLHLVSLLGIRTFLEQKAIEGDSPVEVTEKEFEVS